MRYRARTAGGGSIEKRPVTLQPRTVPCLVASKELEAEVQANADTEVVVRLTVDSYRIVVRLNQTQVDLIVQAQIKTAAKCR